jgi:hypothetical protein
MAVFGSGFGPRRLLVLDTLTSDRTDRITPGGLVPSFHADFPLGLEKQRPAPPTLFFASFLIDTSTYSIAPSPPKPSIGPSRVASPSVLKTAGVAAVSPGRRRQRTIGGMNS